MIVRARFLVPRPGTVVENGEVRIESRGTIASAGPRERHPSGGPEILDCGDAAILPGLVNAHVHLELCGLRGRVAPGADFTQWLRGLIRARAAQTSESLAAAAASGIGEAVRSGTTTLGEISTSGYAAAPAARSRVRAVVFEEVYGLARGAVEAGRASLEARLDAVSAHDGLLRSGVSPHSPYSVSPDLFRAAQAIARNRGLPLAIHVAETREEVEFLRTGDGPFRGFLEELGALRDGFEPPRCAPLEYLKRLGLLDRPALLVHANYLSESEIAIAQSAGCSVVFCPRSHRFFGHKGHPFRALRRASVPVALGTDSLASNDSLDLLAEMRAVADLPDAPPPSEILEMATTAGCRALGLGDKVGVVAPGFEADLTVVAIPAGTRARDVEEAIVRGGARVLATLVAGRILYEERDEKCSTSTSCANTRTS